MSSRLSLMVALAAPLVAQGKDLRDEVILTNDKVVRGRVAERYLDDQVIVMQGGKRVRVKRNQIKAMVTVPDRMREFLQLREAADEDLAEHWKLCAWATEHQLPEMAQLQALHVVIRNDKHEAAHQFLGHRFSKRRGWQWKRKSRWLTRDRYEAYVADMGHPLVLDSEHFSIRTDAGHGRTIETLIDLERFYQFWFDLFGSKLQPRESLRKMQFEIWNDETKFPNWPVKGVPYFVPNPHADTSFTYYRGTDPRPVDLFIVATQHLLYRTVARDADPGGQMQRYCAAMELGLAQWVQTVFAGEPGRARPTAPSFALRELEWSIRGRRYSLKNMLHLTMRDHFYGAIGGRHLVHWASVHMFVQFLMDQTADPKNRDRFLEFVRQALAEGKGDSSRAFDQAMGKSIEELEAPWLAWIEKRR